MLVPALLLAPVRRLLAKSASSRRRALSSSILARTAFLCSFSACCSAFFLDSSSSCFFRLRSSRVSWASLVAFWRIFCHVFFSRCVEPTAPNILALAYLILSVVLQVLHGLGCLLVLEFLTKLCQASVALLLREGGNLVSRLSKVGVTPG